MGSCSAEVCVIILLSCLWDATSAVEDANFETAEEKLQVTSDISGRKFDWPSQSKYPGFAYPDYSAYYGYAGNDYFRPRCTTPLGQSGECHRPQRCPYTQNTGHYCYLNNGFPGVCCTAGTALSSSGNHQFVFGNQFNYVSTTQATNTNEYSKCGVHEKELYRIQGGAVADEGEWPWMAALLRDGTDQYCGGVLVSDRHILTVAHCVQDKEPREIKIRLGEYEFSRKNRNRKDYSVSQILRHEKFDRTLYVNDIALLKLSTQVQFNKRIRPICLPSGNVALEGRSAYVTGWGTVSYTGETSQVLREVLLPIWKQSECRAALTSWTFTDNQICAGYKPGGRDSCQGDSGGPLMLQESSNGWTVVGLVSWGLRCGLPNQPGVYTRVASYLPWIKSKMQL